MADYTDSSVDTRSAYPENAVAAQEWSRLEPVLTGEQLARRFLWGIPLVSIQKNPITGKYDKLEPEDLKDMILRAISQVEMDSKIDVFPVKRSEKKPYDQNEIQDSGYIRSNYRPILSVDKLSVAPGNSSDVLTITPEWIARDGFVRGEIRIVPALNSVVNGVGASAGVAFVGIIGARPWLPSFWTLEYTTGFADGRVPRALNELIGCYAAIDALSMIATTNKSGSQSINMDGMGQSISTAGPSVYDPRIKLLEEKKKGLLSKFRAIYGSKWVLSNI